MPITCTINGRTVTVNDEERQPCEVWSRVMGYLRPTSEWNVGKKSEFKDRRYFKPETPATETPDPASPPPSSP